jgi:hypothetical protein
MGPLWGPIGAQHILNDPLILFFVSVILFSKTQTATSFAFPGHFLGFFLCGTLPGPVGPNWAPLETDPYRGPPMPSGPGPVTTVTSATV